MLLVLELDLDLLFPLNFSLDREFPLERDLSLEIGPSLLLIGTLLGFLILLFDMDLLLSFLSAKEFDGFN